MKIALKFINEKVNAYKLNCEKLEDINPSSDGYCLYETDLEPKDIWYFKLVNDKIVLDEQRKTSDLEKISKMRLEMELQQKISPLKAELQATDYKAIKFAEGQISAVDYEPTKIERQELRNKINMLQLLIK